MDSVNSEKIHAMKMYKRNELLKSLFLYSFTALACLLYSSPFWFPSLASCMEVLVFVHFPKLSSLVFNSKFVFILGNVIVVALIGESKIFSSSSSSSLIKTPESYYEEYITTKQNLQKFSAPIAKEFPKREKLCGVEAERVCEKNEEEYGKISGKRVEKRVNLGVVVVKRSENAFDGKENHDPCLPTEELTKRADDFIARVNKRRVFEASACMLT